MAPGCRATRRTSEARPVRLSRSAISRPIKRRGRSTHDKQHAEMTSLETEERDRGPCGSSTQRPGRKSMPADSEGTPMGNDIMKNETAIELSRVLAEGTEGFIQMAFAPDAGDYE